jgi:hypothetical protein
MHPLPRLHFKTLNIKDRHMLKVITKLATTSKAEKKINGDVQLIIFINI